MPMPLTEPFVLKILAVILSACGAMSVWMIKRWIDGVDSRLSQMSTSMQHMSLQMAVTQERVSGLGGSISTLQEAIAMTNKDNGRIVSSLEKLWLVVETEKRMSDSCKPNGPVT